VELPLHPSSLRSYGITLADVHLPQLRHRVHLSGQRVNIEVLISEGIGLQRTGFARPGSWKFPGVMIDDANFCWKR